MTPLDAYDREYDSWYKIAQGLIVDSIERKAIYNFLDPRQGMYLNISKIKAGTADYKCAALIYIIEETGHKPLECY